MQQDTPTRYPTPEPDLMSAEHPVRPALRLREVLDLLPVSKSTLYQRIADGRFPSPFKNGRISLWRSEDVARWFADPANLLDYVDYRRSHSRARGRSVVFRGEALEWVGQLERLAEQLVLTLLVLYFEKQASGRRMSHFDRAAAEGLQGRLQELNGGAGARIDALAWWSAPRPPRTPVTSASASATGLASSTSSSKVAE